VGYLIVCLYTVFRSLEYLICSVPGFLGDIRMDVDNDLDLFWGVFVYIP
jgi:hypothetical protein